MQSPQETGHETTISEAEDSGVVEETEELVETPSGQQRGIRCVAFRHLALQTQFLV